MRDLSRAREDVVLALKSAKQRLTIKGIGTNENH